MKITAYSATNYKRIKDIRIEPGERSLLVVGGKNGQGKSSLLDGLTAVFGGARQTDSDPVRHGADAAELTVELDGGAVCIRRRITAGGSNTLEVFDASGKRRSPQAVLDQLVGQRFLDPLAFLRLSPKEQRDALLGVTRFPEGFSLPHWEVEHAKAYEARRDLGRARKQAEAEANAPAPPPAPEPVSASELLATIEALDGRRRIAIEHDRRLAAAKAGVARACEAVAKQREIIERAKARLAELERAEVDATDAADAIAATEVEDPAALESEIATAREQLTAIEATNRDVAQAAAKRRTWDEAQARAAAAREKHEAVEAKLVELDEQKAAALAAAETPLEGVDIDATQVLLGGVPFAQASNAEQLRASLAIAMAMSPTIQDIWVKDGSLLDADSLELVRQAAEERGYRVWLERVGEGDPGALIIQAGELKAGANEEAA